MLNFKVGILSLIYIALFWLFLVSFFFTLGSTHVDYYQKNYAIFKFNNQSSLYLDIKFKNKISDEITIQLDKPNSTPIKIKVDDFSKFFVESTKENFNEPTNLNPVTNQLIYKQSFYEYHHKVNIDNLIQEGKNTIIITFKTNELINNKKSYKLINQINYTNGKYDLFKQDLNVL